MRKTLLFLNLLIFALLISSCGKDGGTMTNQEKAEKFADQMKPKIEKRIHAEDYNNYVKKIDYTQVKIDPLGGIQVEGYINNNKDYFFVMDLNYEDTSIPDSFTFSDTLSQKMGNFDKDEVAPIPEKETSQNTSSDLETILSKYKLNL